MLYDSTYMTYENSPNEILVLGVGIMVGFFRKVGGNWQEGRWQSIRGASKVLFLHLDGKCLGESTL